MLLAVVAVPPFAGKLAGAFVISLYAYEGLLLALAHAETSLAGKVVG
jgi:hypothetical protein